MLLRFSLQRSDKPLCSAATAEANIIGLRNRWMLSGWIGFRSDIAWTPVAESTANCNLSLRCISRDNALLMSSFVIVIDALLILYLFIFSRRNLRSLIIPGNKHDRRETLTQCAEWSEFAFAGEHFFGNLIQDKTVTAVLIFQPEAPCEAVGRLANFQTKGNDGWMDGWMNEL